MLNEGEYDMKIVIIGSVAAGTSAAAKARRNSEEAEIKVFDADEDISYSGCGLPYYIGPEVEERAQLVPRDVTFFKQKYNVDVYTSHRVLEIQPQTQTLTVKNLTTGQVFAESYDRLVIATGAQPVMLPIEGGDKTNVFTLRNVISADHIRNYILTAKPAAAVIIGSGFIGLELAENLVARGIKVTIVELAGHVMPALDEDVAVYIQDYLKEKGITVIVNDSAIRLTGSDAVDTVILKSGQELAAGLVVMAVGVKPNVELAKAAGIEIGKTGAIAVNTRMQTNFSDIYACGDCVESYSLITGKPFYRPLGSTANKMGRIVGDQITGGSLEFQGGLGTGIFKVFDMAVAQTGLTEKEAKREGYEVVVCHNIKPDKAEYFGGQDMLIKAVADKKTGKLLGAQIVGKGGVDKRIDVLVTAITFGAKAEDLFHLDLAYSPPFSTTKDPVMYTGMILDNVLNHGRNLMTPRELREKAETGGTIQIIDTRTAEQYQAGHVNGARNIPQNCIRQKLDAIDKELPVVTYCNMGVTGNASQNILLNHGFKQVFNLSGGYKNFEKNEKK